MTENHSTILSKEQRTSLNNAVQEARREAEAAAADALRSLGVDKAHDKPAYLTDEQNKLRLALRTKARQLGDNTSRDDLPLTSLIRDVAYEQWHRLLFAKFLEVNGLLRHRDYPDIAVTLLECDELASELGQPDGWAVAADFASRILPGVFRPDDPAVQVAFSAEYRQALEALIARIPASTFKAEDALGWVYQFWQTAEKKRVNDSGEKIGGADLSPVTQLFTENYMVRFLLENSLGAWWAARHPDSPLIKDWQYLRFLDNGCPAAGTFLEWPATAAAVTTLDPCCGSGHFLVALFGMLWRMRAEEENLTPIQAQDAVLRSNLFGLELDPRCTQIATFNVALEAWKQGGFRSLPTPQIACSGVPIRQTRAEWLNGIDDPIQKAAMDKLWTLFRDADTLGSLIDPTAISDGTLAGSEVAWDDIRYLLADRIAREDQAQAVLGHAADDVVHAAELLSRKYTLVATNPPYLGSDVLEPQLRDHLYENNYKYSHNIKGELAYGMQNRFLLSSATLATVIPQSFMYLKSFEPLRKDWLKATNYDLLGRLAHGAFTEIKGEVVNVVLVIQSAHQPRKNAILRGIDASQERTISEKASGLRSFPIHHITIEKLLTDPETRISFHIAESDALLKNFADVVYGSKPGQTPRVVRYFWEVEQEGTWMLMQTSPDSSLNDYSGCDRVMLTFDAMDRLGVTEYSSTGEKIWKAPGIIIAKMGSMKSSLYAGNAFDDNTYAIIPKEDAFHAPLYSFIRAPDFRTAIKKINQKFMASISTVESVPFDIAYWKDKSATEFPTGMPQPASQNPSQWLFKGDIPTSEQPLQVAIARLLGYRWPDQPGDSVLDVLTDEDGIVPIVALPGERDAEALLRELLAAAYGDAWSVDRERDLVRAEGGADGDLGHWLRDKFFANHAKLFGGAKSGGTDRPFVWHIWDGRKDGFSALVNYRTLDRKTLEKLTYTTLGAWISRQRHDAGNGVAGADLRLAAAQDLQDKLALIIEGEAPYDIYVRWKQPWEQAIGWEPDLDDGVRMNIRPFIQPWDKPTAILRAKVNVKWEKDHGKNPDGSDRINDIHLTLEAKRKARAEHERKIAETRVRPPAAPVGTRERPSQGSLL
jgi:hypothetical protein